MNYVHQLISSPWAEALGWTILNSLWQGGIVAILLAVTMLILRRSSSHIRYLVASGAMLLIFLGAIITFTQVYDPPVTQTAEERYTVPEAQSSLPFEIILRASSQQQNWWQRAYLFFDHYFERHLPFIVSVWLMGVFILTLRFVGGYAYLQRLRHYKTREVNEYWQGTIRYLSAQIGVKKSVRLVESALVQVPLVIGFLKPVVLMPLGALNGLSQEQIESILAHELAHIRRHDYLINLLQSFMEILLFFNPFVWWVSNQIRLERENCCDDIALATTGDQVSLVKSLTAIEEMRLNTPRLALGFAGKRGGLLNRVQRLIDQKQKGANFSEGFLSALVLFFCLFIAAFTTRPDLMEDPLNSPNTDDTEKENELTWVIDSEDSPAETELPSLHASDIREEKKQVIRSRVSIQDTIRFKQYMIITNARGEIEVYRDGKRLEKEEFAKYTEDFKVEKEKIKLAPGTDNEISIRVEPKPSRSRSSVTVTNGKSGRVVIGSAGPPMPPWPVKPPMSPLSDEHFIWIIDGDSVKHQDFDFDFDFDFDDDTGEMHFEIPDIKVHIDNDEWKSAVIEYRQAIKEWSEEAHEWAHDYAEEWAKEHEIDDKCSDEYKKAIREYHEEVHEKQRELQEELRDLNQELRDQEREIHRERIQIVREAERAKREAIREKENERRRGQQERLREYLVEDNLLDEDAQSIKIRAKDGNIQINGKTLEGETEKKYHRILKETMGWDIDSNSVISWTWSFD